MMFASTNGEPGKLILSDKDSIEVNRASVVEPPKPEPTPDPEGEGTQGGVALASQYCDVIVGEKHLYDMLLRNRFKIKAVVFRRLSDLEQYLEKAI